MGKVQNIGTEKYSKSQQALSEIQTHNPKDWEFKYQHKSKLQGKTRQVELIENNSFYKGDNLLIHNQHNSHNHSLTYTNHNIL